MSTRVRTTLPGEPISARAARQWVRGMLPVWVVEGARDRMLLVTSELVANAVIHGEGAVDLALCDDGRSVTIEATDSGHGEARCVAAGATAPGGRGLRIVSCLSTHWGVRHPPEGGTTVWAEFAKPTLVT